MTPDMTAVAAIAGGVGAFVTGITGVIAYFIERGRTDGGVKSDISNLNTSIIALKNEVRASIASAAARTEEAHDRIDIAVNEHHELREMIAKEYVTYERMREFKTELVFGMDKLSSTQGAALSAIHGRLDAMIHTIAKIGQAPRSQDG